MPTNISRVGSNPILLAQVNPINAPSAANQSRTNNAFFPDFSRTKDLARNIEKLKVAQGAAEEKVMDYMVSFGHYDLDNLPKDQIDLIISKIFSSNPKVKESAFRVLSEFTPEKIAPAIITLFESKDANSHAAAVALILRRPVGHYDPGLLSALDIPTQMNYLKHLYRNPKELKQLIDAEGMAFLPAETLGQVYAFHFPLRKAIWDLALELMNSKDTAEQMAGALVCLKLKAYLRVNLDVAWRKPPQPADWYLHNFGGSDAQVGADLPDYQAIEMLKNLCKSSDEDIALGARGILVAANVKDAGD